MLAVSKHSHHEGLTVTPHRLAPNLKETSFLLGDYPDAYYRGLAILDLKKKNSVHRPKLGAYLLDVSPRNEGNVSGRCC